MQWILYELVRLGKRTIQFYSDYVYRLNKMKAPKKSDNSLSINHIRKDLNKKPIQRICSRGNLMHEPLNWTGHLTFSKIFKTPLFLDISNSFHIVTRYGLKPLHFFPFKNISKNRVTRGVQNCGQNGPWLAGQLSNCQNFCIKLSQTYLC